MRITGYISRLIPGELGAADRIFFQPDRHIDLSNVDGKHRAGSGEMIVEASLEGRAVGGPIEVELSNDADPLAATLTVVR